MEQAEPVLVFVRDLMFSSRITTVARDAGIDAKVVRTPEQLASEPGRKLMVDLNQEGFLQAALEWRKRTGRPVVGFVSHVDSATIAAAREGGIDQVMSRGQFVNAIADLLNA